MSSLPVQPNTIITAHASADFDALASMVAARRLYPNAVLVAPSFFVRQVAHPFLEEIPQRFDFVQPKDCDFSQVELVVVVDTRNPKRLEHIREALDKPGVRIHLYDHHPDRDDDLHGEVEVVRMLGSTTTILCMTLQEKGVPLTDDEATMLGLGLYEDTGHFTHGSTTPEDFAAGAFLRSQGMHLDVIKSLATDLTGDEIHLLGALLRNLTIHNIQGTRIAITEIVLDEYVDEFANLVEKLMQVDPSLTTVITLAVMLDKIHIIARSKDPLMDMGNLCENYGGGGHRAAASAVVKDLPLAEVKAGLMAFLVATITPMMTVETHMTAPAKTMPDTCTMGEAASVMTRYGLKAMPIVSATTGACVGILDQKISARAVTHKLETEPVFDFMHHSFRTLPPNSPLQAAVKIILHERQRLIPVEEQGKVVGVLTRTDIIRLLIGNTSALPDDWADGEEKHSRDVVNLLKTQVSNERFALLEQVGALADKHGIGAFVVGGFVRDLLLKQPNQDCDISVEGSAIPFAKALAEELGGRVRVHEKFNTAIVFYTDSFGNESHLDIATARLEYYERPAALPTVELSSIKMDLYRRDFTINALAVQLNKAYFGRLIDPFGGQRDLRNKLIAILHSLSLVEDPTRMLRAVRFEQRFAFRISPQTERLIKNALKLAMVEKLSGTRLFNELKHIFDEKKVTPCFARMQELGILPQIHPALRLVPGRLELMNATEDAIKWYCLQNPGAKLRTWVPFMLTLCGNAKYQEARALVERLGFTQRERTEFLQLRETIKGLVPRLAALDENKEIEPIRPSQLYFLLHSIAPEGLVFLMARYGDQNSITEHVALYITRLQGTRLKITGDDLQSLGEKPGPLFRETLRAVLEACLDGKTLTKREQLSFANEYMLRQDTAQKKINELLAGRT